MAIQSQPSRISEPFAGSGTKNVIPATNATPSASQAASWASGFPPECSQPISAGGCPVPRNDVNGVLNWLSQGFAFNQDGGVWEWSALADYDSQRVVRGSDGLIYYSKAQSGPSIAAGAQDPTADTSHTYWDQLPSDNADIVHISGTETVTGEKTFTGAVYDERSSDAGFRVINPYEDLSSPTAMTTGMVYALDVNKKYMASVVSYVDSTVGTEEVLRTFNASGMEAAVAIRFSSTGKFFLPATDNEIYLGYTGGHRWKQVYAGTATISTSDARCKTSPEEFPDEVLDAWGEVDFVQFQMLDAVAEKGAEAARLHSGVIAQQIDAVFKAHGLDASRYGLFCWDSWVAEPERVDEETGAVIQPAIPAGEQYSLRYEEALCMEAAYQRRRADRAEARLAALEERMGKLEALLAASMGGPVAEETAGEVQDAENQ